jgi:hypothetical protein
MSLRLEITIPPQVALDLDARRVRAVLRSAGSEIAALAGRKVRQSAGTGKTYYGKGGKHRASLPGQPPASWTGQLANSISARVFRGGDGVLIRDSSFYARFLETGARGGVGAKAALLPPGEHLADGDEVFDIDADRDGRQRAATRNIRRASIAGRAANPTDTRADGTPQASA